MYKEFFISLSCVVCLFLLNATFNNILVISWWSVLLVEETGWPEENHRTVARLWQTLSPNVVQCTLPWSRFELTISVVIGTERIGSCKSSYFTITTTTAPCHVSWEEFEDTKGVIRIRISKTNQEKVQKDKQRSTKHTHKIKDRGIRIPLKTRGELRCSGKVTSSCSNMIGI